MCIKNTAENYGIVAKLFHWGVALLVIFMLALGFWMTGLENSPLKFEQYGLHKSIGATILVLAVLRLGWRLMNLVPKLPQDLPDVLKLVARATHYALYGLLFAMPLSGWAMSSAAGFGVSVFGWFTLPNLVAADKDALEFYRGLHYWFAWALVGLVALHAGAALWHHVARKDRVLLSMLPRRR